MERRARERSFNEWPGRTPPRINQEDRDAHLGPYLPLWVKSARKILIDTAKQFRSVIYVADLGALVEAKTGRPGPGYWNWMRETLRVVSEQCNSQSEPVLSALCVNDDRTVSAGFSDWASAARGESEAVEAFAARERLACYRYYGEMPHEATLGTEVTRDDIVGRVVTFGDQLLAERRKRQRAAEAAHLRAAERRRYAEASQRRRDEVRRHIEAAKRYERVMAGSFVEVYFDGDPEDAHSFVIGHDHLVSAPNSAELVSVESPLGAALIDACTGETRTIKAPRGGMLSVTVVVRSRAIRIAFEFG